MSATTTAAPERVPEFDLMELAAVDDPYPLFAEWRRAGPVMKAGLGQWGVTRHEDVARLLRDRRLAARMPREYAASQMGDGPSVDFRMNSILNRDGDDHTRLRRLVGQAFSASLVRRMREHIVELVDGLLEPLLDGAEVDLVSDLAFPLPSTVICEMLGISGVDRDEVARRAVALTSQDQPASDDAVVWMRRVMTEVLAERTPDPEGDLFQRMLAAEDGDDALSHEEIVDNAAVLFFAGFETTKHLIGNGAMALMTFPDQWDRLRADPDLAPSAVEEFLRYDGPVPMTGRVALEPVEIGCRTVKEERFVWLLLASANHDERVFEHPERVDIGRRPNPHVAFGGGPHHCLGAWLARVEGDVVFRRLAERFEAVEPAGAPRRATTVLSSYSTLPVRAVPA